MTAKRFTIFYNEQAHMIQYVDSQKEEPNRWSIWNGMETIQKMNALHEENIRLKEQLNNCTKKAKEEIRKQEEENAIRWANIGGGCGMTTKRFENRLNKDNIKFNTLNPVWDNEKETGLNVFEMIDLMNELHDEKQSVIKWIDNKIEEIKPYNSELCRATLLELKELLE